MDIFKNSTNPNDGKATPKGHELVINQYIIFKGMYYL